MRQLQYRFIESLSKAIRETPYIVWWHSFPNFSTQLFDDISKVPDMYTVCFTLKKCVGKIGRLTVQHWGKSGDRDVFISV